jgi:acyl-coenzyme A thioesterase PaaI-like protein
MTTTAVLQTPEASASVIGRAFQEQIPDNFCYGCGPGNPVGLRIRSIWAGNEALCVFQPAPYHSAGPRHILNGGIIATLIDCHAVCTAIAHAYRAESRAIGSVPEIWYATASLAVRYLRPTPIDRPVAVRARVVEARLRRTILECSLSADDVECVRADVVAVRVLATWREEPQATPMTARHNDVAHALWPPTAQTIVAPSRRASTHSECEQEEER